MLLHVPDGASGTVDRSVEATVDVGAVVGEVLAVADGDTDADDASFGLAGRRSEGEPVAVAPTQPAASTAVSATSALHLRQARPLATIDSTAYPSRKII
jgi:pyruvate/2-oxoglutarate dehydrogenase complex dihydrolipoamide acyltransferase (E2) component